jgi:hypothetical protein
MRSSIRVSEGNERRLSRQSRTSMRMSKAGPDKKHSLYSEKDDVEDLKKGLIKQDPNAPTPEEIMLVD